MSAIESWVVEVAAQQGGVITRAQLVDGGLSVPQIRRRRDSGAIVAVGNDAFRVYAARNHIDHLTAAVSVLPNAVVSHESAATLHRFPKISAPRPTVMVHSRTTHEYPAVVVHRCHDLDRRDIVRRRGLPVTSIPRTAVDLAAVIELHELDQLVEELIITDRLRVDDLGEVVDRVSRRGKPGSASLRRILQKRSNGYVIEPTKLERAGLSLLDDYGFPDPETEYPIPWSPERRFDIAWPSIQVAIEWDSRRWHSSMAAMERDRQRDREAAAHGWVILRFTWHEVTETPDVVAKAIRSVLATR